MALYLIGDVQGCDEPLGRLLDKLAFSPSRDTVILMGDLVNRGPASAAVLRRVHGMGASAQSLLGNHDLHLLGVAHGARRAGRKDTLSDVLDAPDRDALLDWLRHQHMALHRSIGGGDLLMVHAGVPPQWTVADTLANAAQLSSVLRGARLGEFLQSMYGNQPGPVGRRAARRRAAAVDRQRADAHALLLGRRHHGIRGPRTAPRRPRPGLSCHGSTFRDRKTQGATVAFGHWSTLGWKSRPDLISTDTGCVWGGSLSAVRMGATLDERELIQCDCPQAQKPG